MKGEADTNKRAKWLTSRAFLDFLRDAFLGLCCNKRKFIFALHEKDSQAQARKQEVSWISLVLTLKTTNKQKTREAENEEKSMAP